MIRSLQGRVCLVTGASRGIGRGIALQLGEAGGIVYITGRSKKTLDTCCQEIKERGGQGIPVVVDHGNPQEIKELFEKIKKEQNGQLFLLVNNAYAAVDHITRNSGIPFWKTNDPVEDWDVVNNVGLRNHYICTTYASRIMTENKKGLIVNVSSPGGLRYLFNVSYGIGKAANDRMAADCAHELKRENVAMVSLWPGPVRTETIAKNMEENAGRRGSEIFKDAESTEFAGMAIAHLAKDPDFLKKSGRVLITADLAREYGFKDTDGKIHGDFRSVKYGLRTRGWTGLAEYIPEWLRAPLFVLHFMGYKF